MMNIRDLQPENAGLGLEDVVIYGIDPLPHFVDLLREDLEEEDELQPTECKIMGFGKKC